MVIACWCQQEETPEKPLTEDDKARLQFLYDEWAHPYFISIQEFCRIMEVRQLGRRLGFVGWESVDWVVGCFKDPSMKAAG